VPDFYVEQAFAAPLTTAAERSLAGRLIACCNEHGARLRDLLVDAEHQRIVCRVEAHDLERARSAISSSGLEPDGTWLAEIPGPPPPRIDVYSAKASAETTRFVDVIAECRRATPIDATSIEWARQACKWCLDTFRVRPGPLVISADGRRVLAFFRAPDAEAVRACYRQASVPFDRVVALRRIEQAAFA
jgi:hypothetical protein